MTEHKKYGRRARGLYRILIVICALALIMAIIAYYINSEKETASQDRSAGEKGAVGETYEDPDKIVNGIHLRTGLVVAEGYQEVINNCTNCHSASLVIQNRMDTEGWEAAIRWMQETQNLWDLGENKEVIIRYLTTNYPVKSKGRREALKDIEWYRLRSGATEK